MRHRASSRFWQSYRALPSDIQVLADKNYRLLLNDPHHPSLHFKKIGGIWSVRVGLHFRALAIENVDEIIWFWIGTHAQYDALVKKRVPRPP